MHTRCLGSSGSFEKQEEEATQRHALYIHVHGHGSPGPAHHPPLARPGRVGVVVGEMRQDNCWERRTRLCSQPGLSKAEGRGQWDRAIAGSSRITRPAPRLVWLVCFLTVDDDDVGQAGNTAGGQPASARERAGTSRIYDVRRWPSKRHAIAGGREQHGGIPPCVPSIGPPRRGCCCCCYCYCWQLQHADTQVHDVRGSRRPTPRRSSLHAALSIHRHVACGTLQSLYLCQARLAWPARSCPRCLLLLPCPRHITAHCCALADNLWGCRGGPRRGASLGPCSGHTCGGIPEIAVNDLRRCCDPVQPGCPLSAAPGRPAHRRDTPYAACRLP